MHSLCYTILFLRYLFVLCNTLGNIIYNGVLLIVVLYGELVRSVAGSMLDKQQAFYNAHKKEYFEKYPGKILVITDHLEGVFNNNQDAFNYTKNLPLNTFMVQPVVEEPPLQVITVVCQ